MLGKKASKQRRVVRRMRIQCKSKRVEIMAFEFEVFSLLCCLCLPRLIYISKLSHNSNRAGSSTHKSTWKSLKQDRQLCCCRSQTEQNFEYNILARLGMLLLHDSILACKDRQTTTRTMCAPTLLLSTIKRHIVDRLITAHNARPVRLCRASELSFSLAVADVRWCEPHSTKL